MTFAKPGGITPTTRYESPPSWMLRPTAARGPPSRRAASPLETTTMFGVPGRSSSAVKPRPKTGSVENTVK